MNITVACVQMKPERFKFEENLKKICNFIEQAMKDNEKTNLIIFPELITTGYECGERFIEFAEVVPNGVSMKKIGELAKSYNVSIVYGFAERDANNKDVLYNSAALINNDGNVEGVYRKNHLFDTEKNYFHLGDNFPVFDTPFGKIGIMICWDTAFPEVARIYALKGADLIVVSTNWESPYSDDWDLVTRARAFDNCIYLAAANRVGTDEKLSFFGHSKIVGPLGKVIKELNENSEGIISAELELEMAKKLRKEYYTFFEDRRPEIYEVLVK